jgi:mannose-6-phosphate isomerase-like protein (cupin superfamily)
MPSIHIVRPGEGEIAGGGKIQVRILEDGSHTEHRLGLTRCSVPAGPGTPPPHRHAKHDEAFIILSGTLHFITPDGQTKLEAGSVAVVPAGVPHTFSNPGPEPVSFINAFTPDLYIQFFRDLGGLPLNAQGVLEPAEIGKAMAKYHTEVVLPKG